MILTIDQLSEGNVDGKPSAFVPIARTQCLCPNGYEPELLNGVWVHRISPSCEKHYVGRRIAQQSLSYLKNNRVEGKRHSGVRGNS